MSRITYGKKYDISSPGRTWGLNQALSVKTYTNDSPGDKEQWTIGIPATPDADTVYAITVGTYRVAVDSGATPTQTNLQSQLVSAFESTLNSTISPPPAIKSLVTVSSSGTDILLTAVDYEQENLIFVEGNGLTATLTTPKSVPSGIGFGLLVVQGSDYQKAKLPDAPGQRVVGLTMNPYDLEKDQFGPYGKAYFEPGDPMDVLDRSNDAEGLWVQVMENDIVPGDPVYFSYAANTKGKITKNPTNADDLSAIASFQRPPTVVNNNQLIALVRFNLV